LGTSAMCTATVPYKPKKVGSITLGGIVNRAAHPSKPHQPLNGGPQMVELSRDGRRAYFTNSLYSPCDEQFSRDGVNGWMARVNLHPSGSMELDKTFFLETNGLRPHQVR